MMEQLLDRLLCMRGIHFVASRLLGENVRCMAFNAKYRNAEWNFDNEEPLEFVRLIEGLAAGRSILLLGCGKARIVRSLNPHAYEYVLGVDLSDEALLSAREFASPKISFLQTDMTTFEPPHSFRVILFVESVNYVSRRVRLAMLRRYSGHLEPGGRILVTVSQSSRYQHLLQEIRDAFHVSVDKPLGSKGRHLLVFH